MTNQKPNRKEFDLEKRTLEFAKKIIEFCQQFNKNCITIPMITQLIKAGTSVGANYHEANECESKKDFRHKITICKKEAKESMYWLELLAPFSNDKALARENWKEAHELVLIFSSIIKK